MAYKVKTMRLPDDLEQWAVAEAKRQDISFSKYITRLIRVDKAMQQMVHVSISPDDLKQTKPKKQ